MKKTAAIIITVCFIAGGFFSYRMIRRHEERTVIKPALHKSAPRIDGKKIIAKRKNEWQRLISKVESEISGFRGDIGIVIKDLDMNWEIDCNKDLKIPSASLAKIPIMLSYYYASSERRINLKDKIKLKRDEIAPGSGLLKSAKPGQAISIEDLIYFMIAHSDNTAANILIDYMGTDKLNRYFSRMGLKETNLSRKMMDFKARKIGIENYTTAAEMAYLLEKLYRHKFVNKAVSKRCLDLLASQKVNDRIPKKLPHGTIVAHKTGLEKGLCHDVGIVYTSKGNFLICVLARHKSKYAKPVKAIIADIALFAYNYYERF